MSKSLRVLIVLVVILGLPLATGLAVADEPVVPATVDKTM